MTSEMAAFDIEISNTDLPGDFNVDLFDYGPLEFAIGCVATSGGEPEFYENPHVMLGRLMQLLMQGAMIVSWNGLKFDMRVLAYATDSKARCVEIAMGHYDMLFQAFCVIGHPISLNSVSRSYGLRGKIGSAADSKGDIVQVNSSLVPQLWVDGEKGVVREHVAADAEQTLAVGKVLREWPVYKWTTKKGKPKKKSTSRLMTASECMKDIRAPYTGWMKKPMTREDFYAWTL